MGRTSTEETGKADRAASLMMVPASREERVPLKESGAMMMCMMAPFVMGLRSGPGQRGAPLGAEGSEV